VKNIVVFIILIIFLFVSCKKNKEENSPTTSFIAGNIDNTILFYQLDSTVTYSIGPFYGQPHTEIKVDIDNDSVDDFLISGHANSAGFSLYISYIDNNINIASNLISTFTNPIDKILLLNFNEPVLNNQYWSRTSFFAYGEVTNHDIYIDNFINKYIILYQEINGPKYGWINLSLSKKNISGYAKFTFKFYSYAMQK